MGEQPVLIVLAKQQLAQLKEVVAKDDNAIGALATIKFSALWVNPHLKHTKGILAHLGYALYKYQEEGESVLEDLKVFCSELGTVLELYDKFDFSKRVYLYDRLLSIEDKAKVVGSLLK